MTLDVPVFVVINKIDLCSESSIQQTVTCLTYLLKHGHGSFQLDPYVVQREEDLVKAADMFVKKRFAFLTARVQMIPFDRLESVPFLLSRVLPVETWIC